jgi:hypothetical protein
MNAETERQVMADGVAKRSYRVSFSGVGRGKKSWVATLDQMPTESILARLIRKSGALASRDIECAFDDENLEYGIVIVGGFRPVGAFRVEELP